ncbi:histidine kinase [Methylovorus sp. MM2]|uniref:sensor histidine kinase n=1 Tax=Methylovorus sp. MM2 TaxID=1848038 RepID=UPI0007E00D2F|nr:histidine kinase [Methylovorus sp. MM2]
MASIKQNTGFSNQLSEPTSIGQPTFRQCVRLPDFRNLGICLRMLVIVNMMVVIAAVFQADNATETFTILTKLLAFIQPTLLLSLLLLYVTHPVLAKVSYRWSVSAAMILILLATSGIYYIGYIVMHIDGMPSINRIWFLTVIVSGILFYYFNLRQRALTPAIAEARLQALQARIRPHFLFNSINAVLSLIRSQPARAEAALEDMADLFRVLMADNRDLVPLAKEIGLSRQYLALEKLRLDERLNIVWQIDNMPPDALMPPLVLQPLLENAVYHGIEPLPEGGEITIKIYTHRDEIHLILHNPYSSQPGQHSGNKMALNNIRERLALHFDAEASLTSKSVDNMYEVHMVIPYKKSGL